MFFIVVLKNCQLAYVNNKSYLENQTTEPLRIGSKHKAGFCALNRIGHITILVKDQDKAARFYVEKLGFTKCEDTVFGPGMRWVTVSPSRNGNIELTFVIANTKEKLRALGKQAGDHVLLTIETNNCMKDYEKMKTLGVKFYGKPEQKTYGTEVVFEDLYGNLLDLVERPSTKHQTGSRNQPG